MPHIIVKLWPGKSEEQKQCLADAIVKGVTSILSSSDDSVSVAIEEVASSDWRETVYQPEIAGKPEQLYKKPGYSM